jgi:hypothetical protein
VAPTQKFVVFVKKGAAPCGCPPPGVRLSLRSERLKNSII